MADDGLIRKAYPGNGNGKRKVGRPPGGKNPNAGRKPGSKKPEKIVSKIVAIQCKSLLELRAKALVENILQEECHIAFSDIRLLPGCPEGIPDEIAYAIQSFEVDERVIKSLSEDADQVLVARKTKFTLWPKGQALERLSRHLGLYEKDNAQKPVIRPQINLYLEQGNASVGQLPGPEANGYGAPGE
jgi:hypothetical protein